MDVPIVLTGTPRKDANKGGVTVSLHFIQCPFPNRFQFDSKKIFKNSTKFSTTTPSTSPARSPRTKKAGTNRVNMFDMIHSGFVLVQIFWHGTDDIVSKGGTKEISKCS